MKILQETLLADKINNSKRKKEIIEIIKKLQILDKDNTPTKMNKIIYDLNLPLSLHLFITAKYSELMDLIIKD